MLPATPPAKVRPATRHAGGGLFRSLLLLNTLLLALPNTLAHHVLLPILCPLIAVRAITQLPELLSGLGLENSLERFFKRLAGLSCAGSFLTSQNVDGHLGLGMLLFC